VVTVLDQSDRDVAAVEALGEREASLPRHGDVAHAVQQPNRAFERDRLAHDEMALAVLEHPEPIGVAGWVVFGRQGDRAALAQLLMLRRTEPRPHEVLSEIGRRGNADQGVNAFGSGECREHHDPPAHARSHEDLRAFGQRIEHRHRVLCPAADGAQGDIAARSAVAEVVEAHESPASATAIIPKKQRLGAGHVGTEPAEEDDARDRSGKPVVGDCCTAGAW